MLRWANVSPARHALPVFRVHSGALSCSWSTQRVMVRAGELSDPGPLISGESASLSETTMGKDSGSAIWEIPTCEHTLCIQRTRFLRDFPCRFLSNGWTTESGWSMGKLISCSLHSGCGGSVLLIAVCVRTRNVPGCSSQRASPRAESTANTYREQADRRRVGA